MDLSMQLCPPANLMHLHALWIGWIPFISPLAPMGNQVETTKMRSSFQIIKYTSTLLSQVSLGIKFIVDFHWDLDS